MIHGLSRVFLPFWCLDAKGGEISEGICIHAWFLFAFSLSFIAFVLVELYVVCARGTFMFMEPYVVMLWNFAITIV